MRKEEEMIDALMELAKDDAPKVKDGLGAIAENMFTKGMVPKDAMGIQDTDAEFLYAQAYQLYNIGKYKDSRSLFGSLMVMDPTEPKYIFGHAASSHMLKQYDTAAKAYVQQAMLSNDDPVPYYHAADCYLQLNDKLSALVTLRIVVKRSTGKPEFETIKERAEMTIKNLEEDLEVEGLEGAPTDLEKPKEEKQA